VARCRLHCISSGTEKNVMMVRDQMFFSSISFLLLVEKSVTSEKSVLNLVDRMVDQE
jgi:hypothetical protein